MFAVNWGCWFVYKLSENFYKKANLKSLLRGITDQVCEWQAKDNIRLGATYVRR